MEVCVSCVVMFIARVSVCVAYPTHQAGDFPLLAMNIRCFLTSLNPEDPFPNCIPPFTPPSLRTATQEEQEHKEKKRK